MKLRAHPRAVSVLYLYILSYNLNKKTNVINKLDWTENLELGLKETDFLLFQGAKRYASYTYIYKESFEKQQQHAL